MIDIYLVVFFFQAEDGIRDGRVTGVQTCALPISSGCTSATTRRIELVPMSIAARRGKAEGSAAGFAGACGAAGRAPVVAVAVTVPSRGWRVRATGSPLILSRYGARGRLPLSQSCNEASRRNFMRYGDMRVTDW